MNFIVGQKVKVHIESSPYLNGQIGIYEGPTHSNKDEHYVKLYNKQLTLIFKSTEIKPIENE